MVWCGFSVLKSGPNQVVTEELNVLTCVEICAGAGGQALGLHMAGFQHLALVEYEPEYCEVLRHIILPCMN